MGCSFPFLFLNTLDWFHWSAYTKTFLIHFFFNHQQKFSSSCPDVCPIQLSRFSLSLPSSFFPMYQSLCNVWKVMAGYGIFHGKLKLV